MDSIRLVTQEEISSRCIQGRKHSFRDDKETQLWELEDIEDLTSSLDTKRRMGGTGRVRDYLQEI